MDNQFAKLTGEVTITIPDGIIATIAPFVVNEIHFGAFSIGADGKITKGESFTTDDEMSLEFWRKIEQAFPRFLTSRG